MIEILGPWGWWIIAGSLLLLELVVPGVFFVWFALAAMVLGLVHLFLPLSLMTELILFGFLAVAFAIAGRMWLSRKTADDERPHLNERQLAHVGRRFRLKEAIRDGRGHLIIDDTRWDITGPDLDAGQWVEITGADGLRLMVKSVSGPAA